MVFFAFLVLIIKMNKKSFNIYPPLDSPPLPLQKKKEILNTGKIDLPLCLFVFDICLVLYFYKFSLRICRMLFFEESILGQLNNVRLTQLDRTL